MPEVKTTELSLSMTKTIQEKQFEPMVISASVKIDVPEGKDIEKEADAALNFLEDTIEQKFKDRGVL